MLRKSRDKLSDGSEASLIVKAIVCVKSEYCHQSDYTVPVGDHSY